MDSRVHCPSGTGVLLMPVWKLVAPASAVCKLTLKVSAWVAVGPSFTHTLMEYCEPVYFLLATVIWGPSFAATRFVTSRLPAPECASEVVLATLEPARELQPSTPPSSKLVAIPELSWGPPGGPAISLITTSSM